MDIFGEILDMPPLKPKNLDVRAREYLRPDEVEQLIKAAGKDRRHRLRDQTLILLMYRHGLRVSEAAGLRWQQIDWRRCQIHINRCKGGKSSTQPLQHDELLKLRALQHKNPEHPYVFVSQRGVLLSNRSIHHIIQRAGQNANLGLPVHPHMLRHGCGYYLAARGTDTRTIQDYLGHTDIKHTVGYTRLAPERFVGLWD